MFNLYEYKAMLSKVQTLSLPNIFYLVNSRVSITH